MDKFALHRACPLCEGLTERLLFVKGDLRLVRCAHCSMIYASPVAPDLASGRFYDHLGDSYYLSPEKLESDYAPVRFARELRLFRKYCRGGAVLDVGCSTGAFLYQLQSRFSGDYTVTGTDVTSAALDYAESRGIRVIRTPFLEIEAPDARFDAVTFWAVIEHVAEPRRFLEKASALLNPGGHGFILVPNMESLAVRLLGSRYRYIMPDHLNYFAPATLRTFGRMANLEVLRLFSTHFNPVVIGQDFRKPAERVADAERARLLQRTTRWKQSRWLHPARIAYSAAEWLLGSMLLADNLVLVLRKPCHDR